MESCILARDFTEEDKVLALRDDAFDKLKKYHLNYEYKKKKNPEKAERPLVRVGGYGCCGGEKVDAMKHFEEVLAEKNKELEAIQSKPIDEYKSVRGGFIMFNSTGVATMAIQSLIFRDDLPIIIPNVEPRNIIWKNLKFNTWEKKVRVLLGRILFGNIIFWFFIPAGFIQALANLEALGDEYSFMDGAQDIPPPLSGWIEGLAPPILTIVLFMLVPPIAKAICRLQGAPTVPKVDRGASMKMFFFSVFFVFVFQLIGGSVLSKAQDYVDDPGQIPDELGNSHSRECRILYQFYLAHGTYWSNVANDAHCSSSQIFVHEKDNGYDGNANG